MAYKVTHIPHNPNRTDEEERERFDKMMYNKKSKSQALSNKKKEVAGKMHRKSLPHNVRAALSSAIPEHVLERFKKTGHY